MRLSAAFVAGLIGLGAIVTVGACSDSTDTDNAGGAGGASGASTAGEGGSSAGAESAGTSGSSADAGAAGAAPAGQCTFTSVDCQTCLQSKCLTTVFACQLDAPCMEGLGELPNCLCNPANTSEACQAAFVEQGGDPALDLAECYTLNCMAACE